MKLRQKTFVVFGINNCPHCVRAKELLETKKINHVYINLHESSNEMKIAIFEELMSKKLDYRKAPCIFEFIGGADDLEKLFKTE